MLCLSPKPPIRYLNLSMFEGDVKTFMNPHLTKKHTEGTGVQYTLNIVFIIIHDNGNALEQFPFVQYDSYHAY